MFAQVRSTAETAAAGTQSRCLFSLRPTEEQQHKLPGRARGEGRRNGPRLEDQKHCRTEPRAQPRTTYQEADVSCRPVGSGREIQRARASRNAPNATGDVPYQLPPHVQHGYAAKTEHETTALTADPSGTAGGGGSRAPPAKHGNPGEPGAAVSPDGTAGPEKGKTRAPRARMIAH